MPRGFSCCAHRGRRQSLDLPSFFGCTRGRAMGLHIGAIDGNGAAQMTSRGQSIEHILPDAAPRPAVKTIVDRCIGAVFRGTFSPRPVLSRL